MAANQIAYVSTYPPRGCGIATFTRDLARSLLMRGQVDSNIVVAVENGGNHYSNDVKHLIDQNNRESYTTAANYLNDSDVDVVSLQHEFGIFGGDWGEYVLDLCQNLDAPLVTTFHTVLQKPTEKALQIITEICRLSRVVVVTIGSAAKLLEKTYGVDADKIAVIGHGAPVPERIHNKLAKTQLRLQNRTILLTCGLISSGKGIEYAIKSLPYLVRKRPEMLYVIVGETHPEVMKHDGEAYRDSLISLAEELEVDENIGFVNRYLSDDELSLYLQAADIYVAPYLGKDQVSSGTLTLALSHGKPIVSTPTTFAEEILHPNKGLLCDFADGRSIAKCVKCILDNPRLRKQLKINALTYGQKVGWMRVADQYGSIFRSAGRPLRAYAQAAT